MLISKQRKKSRVRNCKVLRDSYNYYKENCIKKNIKPQPFKIYSNIIKECNLELLNQVVNESNNVTLPYRLGDLEVIKRDRNYGLKKNWAVDYKRTKEEGFVVYFDQKYLYKWNWNIKHCIVIHKTMYKFTAARKAKRMVAPAIRNGQDFFKLK